MFPTDSPAHDELEVALLGPGVGESVVVHLGAGAWMIVDSCIDGKTGAPAAQTYLEAMGVDLAESVKLVVVTHWHEDHIRGISTILAKAPRARFVCSAALHPKEFETVLGANRMAGASPSEIDEFRKALEEVKRRPKGPSHYAVWAVADKRIFLSGQASVFALSPSDARFDQALKDLASLIPVDGNRKLRVPGHSQNGYSVALHVSFGEQAAVLGGDLEVSHDKAKGWRAICGSTTRPQEKAGLFKVAHHGSPNADCAEIWSDLITANPIAIATPFAKGVRPMPNDEDVERIKGRASELYVTAPSAGRKVKHPKSQVRKMIRDGARSMKSVPREMGLVRYRVASSGSAIPTVSVYGPAYPAI